MVSGIVGSSYNSSVSGSTISNCRSEMDLTSDFVGGILGQGMGVTISNVYSNNNIHSTFNNESFQFYYCTGVIGNTSKYNIIENCIVEGTMISDGYTITPACTNKIAGNLYYGTEGVLVVNNIYLRKRCDKPICGSRE